MQAKKIEEVIADLDKIIDWARTNNSRLGYFAALYRRVTVEVRDKIEEGFFDDNKRMEHLDVTFADRYLAAFTAYRNGTEMSESWRVAFAAADRWPPIVLQHLLVGMNAHINLDLGIAAAAVAPGEAYEGLHDDFNKINAVLASLVDDVKKELAQVWPILGFINRIAAGIEGAVINFSMGVARDEAWRFGQKLAPIDPKNQSKLIHKRDVEVAELGRVVARPPFFLGRLFAFVIRLGERGGVVHIIDILSEKPA